MGGCVVRLTMVPTLRRETVSTFTLMEKKLLLWMLMRTCEGWRGEGGGGERMRWGGRRKEGRKGRDEEREDGGEGGRVEGGGRRG